MRGSFPRGWLGFDHGALATMTLHTHPEAQCEGQVCCIHNPSDHHMVGWPQNWRSDRKIMERICPHGIGHPDPDDYRITHGFDSGVHGCDFCCSDEEDEEDGLTDQP